MNIFIQNLKINKTFLPFFKRQDVKYELDKIEKILLKEKPYTNQFYPYPHEVLRFATLNLDDVKYIILGMDPYPSDYKENGKLIPIATGRSFEVRSLKSWQDNFKQSSLQNILKALYVNEMYNCKSNISKFNQKKNVRKKTDIFNKNDDESEDMLTLSNIRKEIKDDTFKILPPPLLWDDFEKKGIMFLNSTLTVKPYLPNSHTSLWSHFVNELIKYILTYKKEKNQKNILWFIWGENARKRVEKIVDKKDMIYTCHPASRTNNTFVKDNCFQYMIKSKGNQRDGGNPIIRKVQIGIIII